MKYTSTLVSVAALAAAVPMDKRQAALSQDDINTLQLAHYLENLEYALYSGGFSKFSDADFVAAGFPSGFQANVGVIADHEKTHADTLATVLTGAGQTPLPACTYSFPYTDPKSFVDLSNMITSVGIGAYLGGAELVADNPTLEEAAASILTIEARHDAYLRSGVGGSPFPSAFDTGLTALWAFNLAQMFIVSCPQQLPGQVALPKLEVTSPAPEPDLQPPVPAGTTINFKWDPSTFFVSVDPSAPLYIAMVNQNVNTPIFQQVQNLDFNGGTGSVPLPEGVTGAAFAVLTTFAGPLTLNQLSQFGSLAGPVEVLVSWSPIAEF